jgi:hypothetical protein
MTETGYNPPTSTFHATVEWDRPDSLLSTVIETVSVATNEAPENLPPIYDVIDVEAVEALVAPDRSQTEVSDASVQFRYVNCTVTVLPDGEIVVESPQADGA